MNVSNYTAKGMAYLLDLHKKNKLPDHEHLKKKKIKIDLKAKQHGGKYKWERLPRSVERGAARKSMDSLCSEPCPPLDRGDRGSRCPFIRRREMKREGETGRPCAHSLCPGRSWRIKGYLNWQEKRSKLKRLGVCEGHVSAGAENHPLLSLQCFLGKVSLLLTMTTLVLLGKALLLKWI